MASRSMVMVAEAKEPIERGIWLDALEQAGIEATTFERGSGAALGGVQSVFPSSHPVLVPSEHFVTARNIISDIAGADRLLPVRTSEEQISRAQRWIVIIVGAGLAGLVVAVSVRALS